MTSQEAAQAFLEAGLSIPTFHRRVRSGEIESVLPEGKQRGAMYPREQVIAAINKRGNKYRKTKKKVTNSNPLKPSTFSQATIEDMPEMATLLETFYNAKISIEKRGAWIQRNPQVAYILRHEGKLVGCTFLMPLSEEKITQILTSQIKPPTKPDEISLYEPGKHYTLYSRATGVLQSVNKKQRRHWAARLITGLINAVIELGRHGIIIDKIYAQGDTKAGEHALRSLGFMQIELNAPTTRKNFVLDMVKSGSLHATKYKAALNTWRAQNEEI